MGESPFFIGNHISRNEVNKKHQKKLKKEQRNNRNKIRKIFSSNDREKFSTHPLDNFVEVTESVKSSFHNESLRKLSGKGINTNDYDEYLLGGINSFSEDPFFMSMFSSMSQCKNMDLLMKNESYDYVCEGSETGLVHFVKWDKVRNCFLVWKLVPKDSMINSIIKCGGMNYSTNSGQGFESIVNKQITVDDQTKTFEREMK
jgi:hypothetical protein